MRPALTSSCNLWKSGEFYGTPEHNSLTRPERYYTRYPEDADNVGLVIKGGMQPGLKPDGSSTLVKQRVAHCLKMLVGKDRIDMFEYARPDPNTPLAQKLGALADLVDEGKIGGMVSSEVNAVTIQEVAKITMIVAVEIELSLWSTEPMIKGIVKACAKLKIPIIA